MVGGNHSQAGWSRNQEAGHVNRRSHRCSKTCIKKQLKGEGSALLHRCVKDTRVAAHSCAIRSVRMLVMCWGLKERQATDQGQKRMERGYNLQSSAPNVAFHPARPHLPLPLPNSVHHHLRAGVKMQEPEETEARAGAGILYSHICMVQGLSLSSSFQASSPAKQHKPASMETKDVYMTHRTKSGPGSS